MNQTFSFNRWLLLIGKHWSENRKKYLLAMLAITGILIFWFAFNVIAERNRPMNNSMQSGTFYSGLFIVGCLYASTLFSELSSKSKGINFLSVPASHFEKTLTALLFGVVIFFAAYTLMFYVADFIMVKIANAKAFAYWEKNHSAGEIFYPQKIADVFRGDERMRGSETNPLFMILLCYFAVQSAFILGSVYFVKFSFIKTTVSLLVFSLLIALFFGKVLSAWIPDGHFYDGLTSYRLNSGSGEDKFIRLPEWINTVTAFLLKYAFTPIFWMVTYFRLKEKEI